MDPVVLNPNAKGGTVIFLHGLGDTGHGWSAGFEAIQQSNVKYIFPTADVMPVTINGNMPMPSWFDIHGLKQSDKEDVEGIKKASATLLGFVQKEIERGVESKKIIIGGFSQGGAVSLYTALTANKSFAGVVGLSCWLPLHKDAQTLDVKNKDDIPLFQGHGDLDPMVSLNFGKQSGELMKSKGFTNYTFKQYKTMMHGSCPEEMEDVANFIKCIIPPN